MQTITGRHQLTSPSKFANTYHSEYGRLQLVTINQSWVSPELFKVYASKTKSYAQELVLETAAPQMTMQMSYVNISLPSHRSQEKTVCTSCKCEYIN